MWFKEADKLRINFDRLCTDCEVVSLCTLLEKMVLSRKKLLVLDVNGLLIDTYFQAEQRPEQPHDAKVNNFYVYKRPFCEEFMQFCLEHFVVGVWSSARQHNVLALVEYMFKEAKDKLAFIWHQRHCTDTKLKHPENKHKPVFLKELSKLWNKSEPDLPWEEGDYGPSNTILIDDSPYKALRNPPHTGIFPLTYKATDPMDNYLAGELYMYLEGLHSAADVQLYLEKHPIGVPSLGVGDANWEFFSAVKSSTEAPVLCEQKTLVLVDVVVNAVPELPESNVSLVTQHRRGRKRFASSAEESLDCAAAEPLQSHLDFTERLSKIPHPSQLEVCERDPLSFEAANGHPTDSILERAPNLGHGKSQIQPLHRSNRESTSVRPTIDMWDKRQIRPHNGHPESQSIQVDRDLKHSHHLSRDDLPHKWGNGERQEVHRRLEGSPWDHPDHDVKQIRRQYCKSPHLSGRDRDAEAACDSPVHHHRLRTRGRNTNHDDHSRWGMAQETESPHKGDRFYKGRPRDHELSYGDKTVHRGKGRSGDPYHERHRSKELEDHRRTKPRIYEESYSVGNRDVESIHRGGVRLHENLAEQYNRAPRSHDGSRGRSRYWTDSDSSYARTSLVNGNTEGRSRECEYFDNHCTRTSEVYDNERGRFRHQGFDRSYRRVSQAYSSRVGEIQGRRVPEDYDTYRQSNEAPQAYRNRHEENWFKSGSRNSREYDQSYKGTLHMHEINDREIHVEQDGAWSSQHFDRQPQSQSRRWNSWRNA